MSARKHGMNNGLIRRSAIAVAIGLCFAAGPTQAQQTSGAVGGSAAVGDVVTIQSKDSSFKRVATVGKDGTYQVSQLPSGTYTVTVSRSNGTTEAVDVAVGSGETKLVDFASTQRVEVVGSVSRKAIDVKSSEAPMTLSKAQIERIPVIQDATAVALLSPTATVADGRIGSTTTRSGNVPAIGGASPAENTYYVNGFNVTNIINGTTYNQVPFEGIGEFQVKSGGFGAEFGRSLGGVVSVTTKRGGNEMHGGVSVSFAPDSLRASSVYARQDPVTGSWDLSNRPGSKDETKLNAWLSGPIIPGKLFGFALVEGNDMTQKTYGNTQQTEINVDSPKYLVKLDWNITDSHLLEFTFFNDKTRDELQTWGQATPYGKSKGTAFGSSWYESGGENNILKWTGWLTDDLTVSALYGRGEYSKKSFVSSPCALVIDARTAPSRTIGCSTSTVDDVSTKPDKREATRVDVEYALTKDHTIRAGFDKETINFNLGSQYAGGIYYRLFNVANNGTLANGYQNTSGAAMEVVRERFLSNGGNFKIENSAWYLEDKWQVTRNVLATLGIRNESFTNFNASGEKFIEVEDTWSPRLGVAWDVQGNGQLKVFSTLGRYYIPVYGNTNVRLAGKETFTEDWYQFDGTLNGPQQIPGLGAQLGAQNVISDGVTPNPASVVDTKLKPMYQDELVLGMQKALSSDWTMGVKYTHRKLGSGMDDVANEGKARAWADASGKYTPAQVDAIEDRMAHYLLTNPGGDVNVNVDLDGTGALTLVTIPASALGMPKPKRLYDAVEFSLERQWDKVWSFQGTYVWSRSRGNTEGYVKSDIGQDDSGITQDFDYPGLMEGADGYLPNDRRHTIKLFGAYQALPELRVGASVIVQSGRPKNCFGFYNGTADPDAISYGAASFYCNGVLVKRGSAGRLPWTRELNLQFVYTPAWQKGFSVTLDVLNVFNERGVKSINESGETALNSPDPDYKRPLLDNLQSARSFRILGKYEF